MDGESRKILFKHSTIYFLIQHAEEASDCSQACTFIIKNDNKECPKEVIGTRTFETNEITWRLKR